MEVRLWVLAAIVGSGLVTVGVRVLASGPAEPGDLARVGDPLAWLCPYCRAGGTSCPVRHAARRASCAAARQHRPACRHTDAACRGSHAQPARDCRYRSGGDGAAPCPGGLKTVSTGHAQEGTPNGVPSCDPSAIVPAATTAPPWSVAQPRDHGLPITPLPGRPAAG